MEIDAGIPSDSADGPTIHILGVNQIGAESGNPGMTTNRTLPWLQDTAGAGAWELWDVTYRDVVVLDAENRRVAVYNLTEHDLHTQANYDSLKSLLLHAAGR